MAYTITHNNGNRVTIHEIGDTVKIPNPLYDKRSLLQPPLIDFTFKRTRSQQDRSKYKGNGDLK